MKRKGINYTKIYDSLHYGKFIILNQIESKNGHRMVNIKFIDTGSIIECRHSDAVKGNVKDPYRKTICNVACIGRASSYHMAYNMWLSMIHRCYGTKYNTYSRYGGRGIRVCDKWLCFEYFVSDLPMIENYEYWIKDPSLYAIDKDLKQSNIPINERIYSVETCYFIPIIDNTCLARVQHSNSKYIGVRKLSDNSFKAIMSVNGEFKNLGVYPTEDLAAIAYNNAAKFYYPNRQIFNNIEYLDPSIIIDANKRPKEMCKII